MLEKTLGSPLDCKNIQPVNPKVDQSWIFIGKTDSEAESPIFWSSNVKNLLIGKDLDTGKDWGQEEKEVTENEMVWWHNRLNGHESEQTLGDREWPGSLACCSPWGRKEFWTWLSNLTITTRDRVLCEKWQVLETDKFGFIHPLSSISAVWPWTG